VVGALKETDLVDRLYLYEVPGMNPFEEANKLFDVWDRDRTPRQRYVSSRYWLPIIEGRGDPGPAFGFTTERKAAPPRFNGN
jgi:hypothetical protein